jgi:hypothetical protein
MVSRISSSEPRHAPSRASPPAQSYTARMSLIPPVPDTPDGAGRAPVLMRYEDLAQNGRLLVESLATSVNEALWRSALANHPLEEHAFKTGTLAILSRFVLETGDGPFGVNGPFEAECKFQIAKSSDANGAVERLYLLAWIDTYAPIDRTNFKPPANKGERALVGRAFAEHVFTRPFAPSAAERKVVSLGPDGHVPDAVHRATSPEELLSLAGCEPKALTLDGTEIAFGLRHTDSNQHVNSLVYPQLFEEASLRRSLEIAYRKPFFAGQRARVALATFETSDALGTCGGVFDADEIARVGLAQAKPHAYVRMGFQPCK